MLALQQNFIFRPIFDVLGEFYSKIQIQSMVQNGVVGISPLAYVRGRTFKRSFIIADEMQNSSPNQMLMMLTRIGEDSKLVITGDELQSDWSGVNELSDLIRKIESYDNDTIRLVSLTTFDVQRNDVVKQILDIYQTHHFIKSSQYNYTSKPSSNSTSKPSNNDAALMPIQHMRKTIF